MGEPKESPAPYSVKEALKVVPAAARPVLVLDVAGEVLMLAAVVSTAAADEIAELLATGAMETGEVCVVDVLATGVIEVDGVCEADVLATGATELEEVCRHCEYQGLE